MKLFNNTSKQIPSAIFDIVDQVNIKSNFCISHPDYKPLEIPIDVVKSLQQLPIEIQNKYLILQLRNFIYGVYYRGDIKDYLEINSQSDSFVEAENLDNNTESGIDKQFYKQLQANNSGIGYFDPGWYVVEENKEGLIAVQKQGLTLHFEPERYLKLADQSAKVGDMVDVLMPSNLLEPEFYVAVGNAGLVNNQGLENSYQTVCISFNFSPQGAISLMKSLTKQLNNINIPFSFKVLYNPNDYNRYECGMLQIDSSNYPIVKPILNTAYIQNKSYFRNSIPLFTKFLAPGLSLAEKPHTKSDDKNNFGLNRCRIIAHGLLQAWQAGDNSQEGKISSIYQQFSQLGIKLEYPYLSFNSQDIYSSLDF